MKYILFLFCCTVLLFSCTEEYIPELKPSDQSVMVVEGFINISGESNIRLSRSKNFGDSGMYEPVNGAAVVIESEGQQQYPLLETATGNYISFINNLDPSQKYRLKIAVNGKQYESAYETPEITSPIDSISWRNSGNSVDLTLHSQGKSNERYFLFNFEETWEFKAKYEAFYKYENGAVVGRPREEIAAIYTCWKSRPSTNILTTATVNYNPNKIVFPLLSITPGDQRLSFRYSMMVNKIAVSRKAYEFYQLIKRNTESTGSIFGPLPSEVVGNITCTTDPAELVIGYISVSSQQQQRVFIPKQWDYIYGCVDEYVEAKDIHVYFPNYIPYAEKGMAEGYFSAPADCMDCTLMGTNRRPTFW